MGWVILVQLNPSRHCSLSLSSRTQNDPSLLLLQMQLPKTTLILWSHGMADTTVLFEAGQAGPPFLERAGMTCEFKAYPRLSHSINNEELKNLESWIKTRLQSNS